MTHGACHEWEERLETALESGLDSELQAHLQRCTGCREALDAARFAGALLREHLEPAGTPPAAFAARVIARIRVEDAEQQSALTAFWRPMEQLASRLALAAAVAILVLTAYIFGGGGPQYFAQAPGQPELTESFPALTGQPSGADEVLTTLTEPSNGR